MAATIVQDSEDEVEALGEEDEEETDSVAELNHHPQSQAMEEEQQTQEMPFEEEEDGRRSPTPPPVKTPPPNKRKRAAPGSTSSGGGTGRKKKAIDPKQLGKETTYGETAAFKEEQNRLSYTQVPVLSETERIIDFSKGYDAAAGKLVQQGPKTLAGQDVLVFCEDRIVNRYGRASGYRNFIVGKTYTRNGRKEMLKISMNEETIRMIKHCIDVVIDEVKDIPVATSSDV